MNNIFSSQIQSEADAIVARYETKRASILEILRLLQEAYGHITLEMEEEVAQFLEIPPIDVREVMTFYSLFYSQPKAEKRFHVCRTLSCSLRGSGEILKVFEEKLGLKPGQRTPDGKIALDTVECLGACEMAPMMQVDDKEYVGPLTKERVEEILKGKGV